MKDVREKVEIARDLIMVRTGVSELEASELLFKILGILDEE